MDLVAINGQMEENILENGKIVKDMEEEKWYQLMEIKDKVYGKMIKE